MRCFGYVITNTKKKIYYCYCIDHVLFMINNSWDWIRLVGLLQMEINLLLPKKMIYLFFVDYWAGFFFSFSFLNHFVFCFLTSLSVLSWVFWFTICGTLTENNLLIPFLLLFHFYLSSWRKDAVVYHFYYLIYLFKRLSCGQMVYVTDLRVHCSHTGILILYNSVGSNDPIRLHKYSFAPSLDKGMGMIKGLFSFLLRMWF